VKYLLINDIHLSDRAPASCTDTYLDDLFDLLRQVSNLAAELHAAIIFAGDVFHHKAPSRTSHATVMRFIDWARSTFVPIYAVAGNHDLQHSRVQSLYETQPLGVVCASGAVELLDGWMYDGAGNYPYGVPWLMTYDDANVFDALASYRDDEHPRSSNAAHTLVVTHAPLYPPGQELKFENYPATQWASAMDNRGTVHYGHVHEPHGIYEVDGVTFSNCGALSRGSLHEHNLTRTPSVAIWDSDTGLIEHRELNAKPADQVFRLQQAAETKAAGVNLSRFLESVKSARVDITSSDSVLNHVRETQEDPALVAVIAKLLEEVK
jgi:DNA repair exonuclease SbcCD nuclease subunit